MGRLIDGQWTNDTMTPDERGRFVRKAAHFRSRITADGSSGFAAEAGRYHLYVSHACGWSHRTVLFRHLERLEDAVSISFVEPHMGDQGWAFAEGGDPVLGKRYLHQIYTEVRADYTGRVTVPVLWDRQTHTIVNNESSEITRDFDRQFDALGDPEVRLFPDALLPRIEAMIDANYGTVNNGVYRAGFAASQQAHEEAARALFSRLDQLEEHLAEHRYLCGDRITAADWFLFPTLFRFDAVYHTHFKCNLRRLADYPNLWAYTRELYQVPGVAQRCDLQQCREHYYTSHESIHPRRYIPIGPQIDWDEPHGRGPRP